MRVFLIRKSAFVFFRWSYFTAPSGCSFFSFPPSILTDYFFKKMINDLTQILLTFAPKKMIHLHTQYPNLGKIEIHQLVDISANDFSNVVFCCDCFAKQGKKPLITPRFAETVGNPAYETIYALNIKTISEVYFRTTAGLQLLYNK